MIERSRFLCTIAYAPTVESAQEFVKDVSTRYADATHNCWAYVVGEPGSTSRIGMSDDGEPHGTAGRPMLNVLLHSGVGDIAAVVTRWFGGTKLGTGGLVRAYSGAVQGAIADLPRTFRVQLTSRKVRISYGDLSAVRQLFSLYEVATTEEDFGVDVTIVVTLPEENLRPFGDAIRNVTRGQSRLEPVAEGQS